MLKVQKCWCAFEGHGKGNTKKTQGTIRDYTGTLFTYLPKRLREQRLKQQISAKKEKRCAGCWKTAARFDNKGKRLTISTVDPNNSAPGWPELSNKGLENCDSVWPALPSCSKQQLFGVLRNMQCSPTQPLCKCLHLSCAPRGVRKTPRTRQKVLIIKGAKEKEAIKRVQITRQK